VTAKGDGELGSPPVKIRRAGFYTYRERVLASPLVAASTTECALAAETSLAAPRIVTGRGDVARHVAARDTRGSRPTRVRVPSVGIDAPVSPVEIDLKNGVLGVPRDIARAGWWKDGMAPGARTGAILVSGHVDSATEGAGAFFSLHRAKAGDQIDLRTASGRTFAYRVVSVRNYPKSALPTSFFSRKGPPRLVLVTCGGPFLEGAGRYRDNVVVTAVRDDG
jgi:sortase (surface protein transpeptidase)